MRPNVPQEWITQVHAVMGTRVKMGFYTLFIHNINNMLETMMEILWKFSVSAANVTLRAQGITYETIAWFCLALYFFDNLTVLHRGYRKWMHHVDEVSNAYSWMKIVPQNFFQSFPLWVKLKISRHDFRSWLVDEQTWTNVDHILCAKLEFNKAQLYLHHLAWMSGWYAF